LKNVIGLRFIMRRYASHHCFARAQSIAELAAMAQKRLPHFAWEYLAGGAGDEQTLAENISAFQKYRFHVKTLRGCDQISCAANVFGQAQPLPMVIAPTGYNGMLYKDADIHLARAASKAGIPFCLSTVSTTSLEDLVRAVPDVQLWAQLYCLSEDIQKDMLKRADAVGSRTLVVTTDAVMLGNREWDKRNFLAPGKLTFRNKLNVLRHPTWMRQVLWPKGIPQMENLFTYLPKNQRTAQGSTSFIAARMQKNLSWDQMAKIREWWPHKLVVKGIMVPEDAARCVALGADGIVVTNHGGRQLDGTPATIDVLPAIAAAVAGKIEILLDSGIRRGTDIVKAKALGASAVLLGRATLYGVAVGGEQGVAHALSLLENEIAIALGLVGQPSFLDVSRADLHAC
jgi:(S)-mandelate dehydrogenase